MAGMTKPKRTKWHAFDQKRAKAPAGPLSMPGAFGCISSSVDTPMVSSNGLTVGTELVVLRIDGTTTKGYAFMVGTSSDGSLHYTGPYKNFPAHHVHPGQRVAPQDFFGHTPASKTKVP